MGKQGHRGLYGWTGVRPTGTMVLCLCQTPPESTLLWRRFFLGFFHRHGRRITPSKTNPAEAVHPRPVVVYQIQAEGTLDQVVQALVEGKADVQGLLMEYCKMKSPSSEGLMFRIGISPCPQSLLHSLTRLRQ